MKLSKAAVPLLGAAALLAFISRLRRPRFRAQRIIRISRVVSDLDRSETFYRDALGFQTVSRGHSDGTTLAALGLGDAAQETVMQLGTATIALVRFRNLGHEYPQNSRSNDLWFQHLAIVVSDMDAAYAHLSLTSGWQPISEGGPQLLPPSNGSVSAFKFRDPDGHPLELIWFPDRENRDQMSPDLHTSNMAGVRFIGVDHSALSISSTRRSLNFYRSLGFRVTARSLNNGPAQNRLDGLPEANLQVTSLRSIGGASPGLELLGYKPPGRSAATLRLNNRATDWVTIEVTTLFGDRCRALRDPDGHRLLLVGQGSGLPA